MLTSQTGDPSTRMSLVILVVFATAFGCDRPPAAKPDQPVIEAVPAAPPSGQPTSTDKETAPAQEPSPQFEGKTLREWITLLGDEDVQTRARAVDAVARVGRPAIAELVTALREPDHQRRRNAARVLGRIGPSAKDAAGDLAASTDDKETSVRVAAAAALIRVAPERAKPALDALIAVLQEKSETAYLCQMNAIQELGELGPVAKPAVPALNSLVWPGFGDPLEMAAVAALKKIDPRPVASARGPWDDIIGDKLSRPGVGTVPDPGAGGSLVPWQDVVRSVGDQAETGRRDGQRFLLLSGRLMVVEGTNALDLFFPPTREGIEAGAAFMSASLFTAEEKKGLLVLGERKEPERVAGRFRLRLGYTDGTNSDLPAHWIRVEFEPADKGSKTVAHAVVLAGNCTADELFTRSKHRELNKMVRSHLGATHPAKELSIRVRTLNNLADAAGYTAPDALAAVERAIQTAKQNGLEPSFGIDAAGKSFAFMAATNKETLNSVSRTDAAAQPKGSTPETEALAAIHKLKGKVTFHEDDPKKPHTVRYEGLDLTAADLEPLAELPTVKVVRLRKVKLTADALKPLARMKGVTVLDLTNAEFPAEALKPLTEVKGLSELILQESRFPAEALKPIADLKGLTYLVLLGTPLTDEGLDHVRGLTELQDLNIGLTKVTDAGLDRLKNLTKLEALNLAGTRVSDEGIAHLKGLAKLKSVNVNFTQVTLKGVTQLESMLPNIVVGWMPPKK